jgi:hypothetical protein
VRCVDGDPPQHIVSGCASANAFHSAGFVPWLAAAAAAAVSAALQAEAHAAAVSATLPESPSGTASAAVDAVDALTALVRCRIAVLRHLAMSTGWQLSFLPYSARCAFLLKSSRALASSFDATMQQTVCRCTPAAEHCVVVQGSLVVGDAYASVSDLQVSEPAVARQLSRRAGAEQAADAARALCQALCTGGPTCATRVLATLVHGLHACMQDDCSRCTRSAQPVVWCLQAQRRAERRPQAGCGCCGAACCVC